MDKPSTSLLRTIIAHPLFGNLLLACLYFLTGHIGLALAAAPNFATIVWPASGIALAWVLLFGFRFAAGVALGSFAVNVFEAVRALKLGVFDVNYLVPLSIGLGAAAQASVGAWLIKRYATYPDPLHTPLNVFKILFLGGVLATLLNSTWSVSILYITHAITKELLMQSWFVWWVGDSIGVFVFTPMLLTLGLPQPFFNKTRAFLVSFVSITTFALAALIFILAVELEKRDRLADFKARTQQVIQQLHQRLKEYENFSLFAQGFFAGSEFVTDQEFKRFSVAWLDKHAEIQAVEWAPKILSAQRTVWEEVQSKHFGHPVMIMERGGTQRDLLLVRAQERPFYFPLLYLEPWYDNQVVFGFDTQSNKGSEALLAKITENDRPLLSVPLKLMQTKENGSLLYTPIYENDQPKTFEHLKGLLVVVLKNEKMLAKVYDELVGKSFIIWVKDKGTGQNIYGLAPLSHDQKKLEALGLYSQTSIEFGQRIWTIDIWPSEQKLASYQSWLTWLVLVVGLLSTSLAISYTLISTGHRQSLETAIQEKTQALTKQNRQLSIARQEADKANAAKSLFLANISHEIRTPMSGVLGMTELLRDTHLSVQQQQYLQVIYASGKAMLSIINDILDYSKIEAGKMEVEQIDVDLGEVLLECSSIFYMIAEQKGIDFIVNIEPNAPTLVQTDPTRLKQVLLNLLSNAFKFTNYGQVNLHVYQQNPLDTWIYIQVADTGIGISAEQQQKLFSAFGQADSTTTRQFGGTGLGLSISKQLIELMHGQIIVESALGKGSSFIVALPYVMANQKFREEHRQTSSALKGIRVLLVDDNNDFGRHIVQQAELWGIHIDIVHDGEYVPILLEKAAQTQRAYHVVILNLQQDHMTALALAEQLNQRTALSALKKILVYGADYHPSTEQLEQAKIDTVIQKPHSFMPLRDAILGVIPQDRLNMPDLSSTHGTLMSALAKKHVLLADDYLVNQMVIVAMLQKLQITADVVSNGKEALASYQQHSHNYAAVLMDCEMPEQDGYVTTQMIRAFEQENNLSAVPIIALTAYAKSEQYQHCLEVGMNDFVTKPLTVQTLKTSLLKHIKA